jgi:NAD(P)-dependent dehydrogenase (short-subunit alcohol dehydrogenase family)
VQLAGKAALVTGAGRRVGRALALGLAAAGCDVAVHYSSSATGAEATARDIKRLGRKAELIRADLRDATAARGLADQAARVLGRLDVLINAAAVMVKQAILEVTPESWDATLDLNLRAYFFVAQGAVPHL